MSAAIDRITILGDGAMGTVCALLLAGGEPYPASGEGSFHPTSEEVGHPKEVGHLRSLHPASLGGRGGREVRLWGRSPERVEEIRRAQENTKYLPGFKLPGNVQVTHAAPEALSDTQLVIVAVPCQYIRPVLTPMSLLVPQSAALVSVAKGIEVNTLLRPTQVVRDVLGDVPVAALSGPSIAPEVAAGKPATVVAASDDLELAELVQSLFSTRTFRVYTNADLIGVELAGAVKNVIAIAAGICDGIGAGDNAKAALLTRGLVEITRLGVALGAHAETFKGLAGVGDLVTTFFSPVSRNRTAGERIGRGMHVDEVVATTESVIEGIPTTQAVLELAHSVHVDMPIVRAVYTVLFEHVPPAAAIEELMTRQLKPE
jgi:glycerol-3-phosphate dehydrogenase (NAD(P)+)